MIATLALSGCPTGSDTDKTKNNDPLPGDTVTKNEIQVTYPAGLTQTQIDTINGLDLSAYTGFVASVTIVKEGGRAVTIDADNKAVVSTTLSDLPDALAYGKGQAEEARKPLAINETLGTIPVTSTDLFTAIEHGQVKTILADLNAEDYKGLVASVMIVKTAVSPAVTLNDDKQAVITTTIAELAANLEEGKTKADAAQNPGDTLEIKEFARITNETGNTIIFSAEEGFDTTEALVFIDHPVNQDFLEFYADYIASLTFKFDVQGGRDAYLGVDERAVIITNGSEGIEDEINNGYGDAIANGPRD